eukprot:CAMPEP_0204233768 /NCGR_PEP_ID=MMETSP0361-20130328/90461_1 /ASSEMBLY_ACC=CAM_ASM_000343 /TAXON_ID=268821 /ORGANISM="Scrippsiella Hangoei, Strain SHTV-5" /LENGTH=185 /DNA_ID=CAMNT_0051204417 /DNA_START=82 /DNA_END=637 /DNA_ORIENTATION=+
MAETKTAEKVQCFGRKKTAVAVALVRTGSGQARLNGCPLHTVKPDILRVKVYEPLLLLGKDRCSKVDIRLRVKGGGFTSQVYALRQAIAKGIVAYYQKYIDEASKKEIKDILMAYDRSLIVADPRRCEPKKFGGRSAARASRSPTAERAPSLPPSYGAGTVVAGAHVARRAAGAAGGPAQSGPLD